MLQAYNSVLCGPRLVLFLFRSEEATLDRMQRVSEGSNRSNFLFSSRRRPDGGRAPHLGGWPNSLRLFLALHLVRATREVRYGTGKRKKLYPCSNHSLARQYHHIACKTTTLPRGRSNECDCVPHCGHDCTARHSTGQSVPVWSYSNYCEPAGKSRSLTHSYCSV